jgi:hypothetical protein
LGEAVMEKPKILYGLIGLWIVLAIIFYSIGYWSLQTLIYIWSPESGYTAWYPLLFWGSLFVTTSMGVFGSIFLIFAYETYAGKSWAWAAGIIISTIFIVIFSFMMASLMITALIFSGVEDQTLIPMLILVMIAFLVDLGIIFLTTRPNIKEYLKSTHIEKFRDIGN